MSQWLPGVVRYVSLSLRLARASATAIVVDV
ncbi:hypothetical protein L195_g064181, partial [Trifolium pratense]